MNSKQIILAGLLTVFLCGTNLWADRIILKGGYEITADILKSDTDTLIADIGCAVLRLDQSQILEIITSDQEQQPENLQDSQAQDADFLNFPPEDIGPQWQLYHTAQRRTNSIEKNAELFGEAVVMVTSPGGQGSGFIVTADGYLITNYHVIAQETQIKITVFHRTQTGFEQKHYKKVKIIALNPFIDLALLKIEDPPENPFKYVYLGNIEKIEAGQQVFAIGNPLGLTRTVSQGIVSTKNRNFEGRLYIQTTADINPGNSGGPLFNLKGQIIGVTSMGYLYLGGLNFAIPVDVVKRFIDNRDAFAYNEDNPNTGYRYLQPNSRRTKNKTP